MITCPTCKNNRKRGRLSTLRKGSYKCHACGVYFYRSENGRYTEMPTGTNAACLKQIVDRLHVATPYGGVRRIVREAMSRTWNDIPRSLRRGILRHIGEVHAKNRETYAHVMGGGHGYTGIRDAIAERSGIPADNLIVAGVKPR